MADEGVGRLIRLDRSVGAEKCFLIAENLVHIALLLPMTGQWPGGLRVAGAAALAVERVNADNSLLPGRTLQYTAADSGCTARQGLKAMGLIETVDGGTSWDDSDVDAEASSTNALIGPGCSTACEVAATPAAFVII